MTSLVHYAVVLYIPIDSLKMALQALLKDSGFQIPSESAKEAHLAASEMLEWLATRDNVVLATPICQGIMAALSKCIPHGSTSSRAKRERMWGKFYRTRTSTEFKELWIRLMQLSIGKSASPIFYQYITDVLFKTMIKHNFPLNPVASQAHDVPPLDYQESNALRYAAGYVPRAIRKRLEKGSHPLKEELVLCLVELCEDDGTDVDASADWTKAISRGGIKLVNNKTYPFFHAVEMNVRRHFSKTSAPTLSAGSKAALVESIATDEDVLFYWSIISAEWEEKEEQILLRMIIDLWMTVRGFSFAKSMLEMYKQAQKKTVQKSKGVRKQLIGKGTDKGSNEVLSHDAD